ncbi:DUF503 domain-containing protein [Sporolituus thermophilus]|uniref:YlxP-like protein n=1 Tax=Sporolituus thermophilus DSM 23256 TaxID=1123285 RepID=A0A1G7ISI8_9FIRM|nr:DUF503 domain-containing protein [Sporolituus thermophilus]SDF15568.1 hypothetical protein SAMN05660235_00621 [Sporolituus thermophilus DSM 23256]
MFVAVCIIDLFLPGAGSLKGKRQILKSIMDRIKARTNASVAETDAQELWQRAVIAVAMVSGDKALLERQIGIIRRIVEDNAEVEQVDFTVEYR